eukprot:CFRG3862T1
MVSHGQSRGPGATTLSAQATNVETVQSWCQEIDQMLVENIVDAARVEVILNGLIKGQLTYSTLKESDVGRKVNMLRKSLDGHPSLKQSARDFIKECKNTMSKPPQASSPAPTKAFVPRKQAAPIAHTNISASVSPALNASSHPVLRKDRSTSRSPTKVGHGSSINGSRTYDVTTDRKESSKEQTEASVEVPDKKRKLETAKIVRPEGDHVAGKPHPSHISNEPPRSPSRIARKSPQPHSSPRRTSPQHLRSSPLLSSKSLGTKSPEQASSKSPNLSASRSQHHLTSTSCRSLPRKSSNPKSSSLVHQRPATSPNLSGNFAQPMADPCSRHLRTTSPVISKASSSSKSPAQEKSPTLDKSSIPQHNSSISKTTTSVSQHRQKRQRDDKDLFNNHQLPKKRNLDLVERSDRAQKETVEQPKVRSGGISISRPPTPKNQRSKQVTAQQSHSQKQVTDFPETSNTPKHSQAAKSREHLAHKGPPQTKNIHATSVMTDRSSTTRETLDSIEVHPAVPLPVLLPMITLPRRPKILPVLRSEEPITTNPTPYTPQRRWVGVDGCVGVNGSWGGFAKQQEISIGRGQKLVLAPYCTPF